ncbi:CAP domain-containing protein [Pseudosulfitobacter sp. SM2401]|uniref:CAP domain-containing protein n=1 Tax=Pseudosulfitobacter sp. SM2401 TaxID=3350098 RepID=UPI0036F41785
MSLASTAEQQMLDLINEERAAVGVGALVLNTLLNDSSEDHSSWMIETDQFSHTGEDGSSATERMEAANYPFEGSWSSGENIAWQSERGDEGITDDVVDLHESLMESTGHRENILNANFTEIGIGIEEGDMDGWDAVVVTQNFASTDGDTSATVESGDDSLSGTGSDDVLTGGTADDEIKGGNGDDSISGGSGADKLYGQSGDDTLIGGADGDTVNGGGGNDFLQGGTGTDYVRGGVGADTMWGGTGNDTMVGNADNDAILGGAGADRLNGGGGDDTLNGGTGDDYLKGGVGSDVFVFAEGMGADEIHSFDSSEDTLRINSDLLNGETTGTDVVEAFGSVVDSNVELDFGDGDVITLLWANTLDGLSDGILVA